MSPLMADGLAEPTVCLPWTAAVTGLSVLSLSVKQPHGLGHLGTVRPRTCVSPPRPGDSLGLICIVSPPPATFSTQHYGYTLCHIQC